ncbi:MAG TPA: hypothetical protein VGB96_15135, partial [Archangium sp.]
MSHPPPETNVSAADKVNKTQCKIKTQRKILALDGGPSALVIIRLLAKIEEASKSGFLEHVDLFAGTSFGGLLCLDLANSLSQGKNPAQALKDCIEFSKNVV